MPTYSLLIKVCFLQMHMDFFPNKSVDSCLVCFVQYRSEAFDCRGKIDVLYADVSRAYDCIGHGVLLTLVMYFGFTITFSRFLESYLTKRSHEVRYSGFCVQQHVLGTPELQFGPVTFSYVC